MGPELNITVGISGAMKDSEGDCRDQQGRGRADFPSSRLRLGCGSLPGGSKLISNSARSRQA
ncbi:hypothetical protein [Bradyrhizobium iriomotense]|uniref:hypothetical protein n=1 Tax=Bradyrhizobium iriomotense TaxID=441950 RepID=UPI0032AEFD46